MLFSRLVLLIQSLPIAYDWHYAYRPATLALLSGHSPYLITSENFSNAPWALIPMIPIALLPETTGRLLLIFVSLISFAIVAVKLGAKPIALVAILLSPLVFQCLYYGQIDFLPLLGLIFPPWLGLFFVTIKPQVGVGIALFWMIEAWQLGRTRKVVTTFLPVTIAILLSFVVFGFWPSNGLTLYHVTSVNTSMWPSGIVFGIFLMAKAIKNKDVSPSMAASPLFSPYVLSHSWITVPMALVRHQRITIATTIAMWIIYTM